ncbi:hypothetical protein [Clostridium sp. JN-9]|uniref:hypothetical protein n=1 Tax=Clostridium sp. JN-9 TaxID=2507159 RepID=UPI000FFDFA58|nr:hypothetical protein [Clostridium sp. JN-9]QAT40541.1 hypothetical protein EQM05_09845 [Clostridium sp. JN-9]
MDNKEETISEILNAKNMIKMLSDEIGDLEERVCNGSISNEDASKYAKSWTDAIKRNYSEIDSLKKELFK